MTKMQEIMNEIADFNTRRFLSDVMPEWIDIMRSKRLHNVEYFEVPDNSIFYKGICSDRNSSIPYFENKEHISDFIYLGVDVKTAIVYCEPLKRPECRAVPKRSEVPIDAKVISFKTKKKLTLINICKSVDFIYDLLDERGKKLFSFLFDLIEQSPAHRVSFRRNSYYDDDYEFAQILKRTLSNIQINGNFIDGYAYGARRTHSGDFHEEVLIWNMSTIKRHDIEYLPTGITMHYYDVIQREIKYHHELWIKVIQGRLAEAHQYMEVAHHPQIRKTSEKNNQKLLDSLSTEKMVEYMKTTDVYDAIFDVPTFCLKTQSIYDM